MSTGNKNYNIAKQTDQETILSAVNNTGSTNDAVGSSTSGSIFAKLNKIIADLTSHISLWTSARASKIDAIDTIKTTTDNIYAKVDTEIATVDTVVDTINAAVGATGNTGGSTTAGTVMAKLNALLTSWTSTRAGYVDNIRSYTVTNNTASKTGVLSAKLAYVISLLENTTYGLSALKNAASSGGWITYNNTIYGTVTAMTVDSPQTITGKGRIIMWNPTDPGNIQLCVQIDNGNWMKLEGAGDVRCGASIELYFNSKVSMYNPGYSSAYGPYTCGYIVQTV